MSNRKKAQRGLSVRLPRAMPPTIDSVKAAVAEHDCEAGNALITLSGMTMLDCEECPCGDSVRFVCYWCGSVIAVETRDVPCEHARPYLGRVQVEGAPS